MRWLLSAYVRDIVRGEQEKATELQVLMMMITTMIKITKMTMTIMIITIMMTVMITITLST